MSFGRSILKNRSQAYYAEPARPARKKTGICIRRDGVCFNMY